MVGELAEAMTRYTYAVSARGANLSVADVKGVRRLLEYGSLHVATVVERAAPAVAGAAEAARALRVTAASADRLRETPAQVDDPAARRAGSGQQGPAEPDDRARRPASPV